MPSICMPNRTVCMLKSPQLPFIHFSPLHIHFPLLPTSLFCFLPPHGCFSTFPTLSGSASRPGQAPHFTLAQASIGGSMLAPCCCLFPAVGACFSHGQFSCCQLEWPIGRFGCPPPPLSPGGRSPGLWPLFTPKSLRKLPPQIKTKIPIQFFSN